MRPTGPDLPFLKKKLFFLELLEKGNLFHFLFLRNGNFHRVTGCNEGHKGIAIRHAKEFPYRFNVGCLVASNPAGTDPVRLQRQDQVLGCRTAVLEIELLFLLAKTAKQSGQSRMNFPYVARPAISDSVFLSLITPKSQGWIFIAVGARAAHSRTSVITRSPTGSGLNFRTLWRDFITVVTTFILRIGGAG
jgi:hypothetical protein